MAETRGMWEVEPGPHEVKSYVEDTSTLTVAAEPGRTYYVWQEVKIGLWKARSALHLVNDENGPQRRDGLQARRIVTLRTTARQREIDTGISEARMMEITRRIPGNAVWRCSGRETRMESRPQQGARAC